MNQRGAIAQSGRKSLLPLQLTLMKSPFFVLTKHLQKYKCYLFYRQMFPFLDRYVLSIETLLSLASKLYFEIIQPSNIASRPFITNRLCRYCCFSYNFNHSLCSLKHSFAAKIICVTAVVMHTFKMINRFTHDVAPRNQLFPS